MGRNKNFRSRAFFITLLTILLLLGLFFIPRLSCFDSTLRRVDILSDVLEKDSTGTPIAELKMDSLQGFLDSLRIPVGDMEVIRPDYKDSIPEGMVAIEDFADSTGIHREMDKFYKALDESKERQVRIAFFGDSYIEGDIFTSALRDLLQKTYGGRGVGWVEVSCITEGFRNTVKNVNSGWDKHHANDKSGYNSNMASLAGSYFRPSSNGVFTLTCQNEKYPKRLSYVDEVSVFADMDPSLHLSALINDSISQTLVSGGGIGMQRFTIPGKIKKAQLNASGSGIVYGMSMDGHTGICLDNFSLRGSSGYHLKNLSPSILEKTAELRGYDLIVFEYGLNIASRRTRDYSGYVRNFTPVITLMKDYFPESSILVIGAGDRAERGRDGQYHTMGGVEDLINYQRKMASDTGIAFWDMRAAIGGDGAIANLQKQGMAGKDMTHINFKGGEHIASILYDVIQNGKMNYDRRRGL